MKSKYLIIPLVLLATAFAFIADSFVPGTLNFVNKGLLAALYIVTCYFIKAMP